jgi:hypothetical protein
VPFDGKAPPGQPSGCRSGRKLRATGPLSDTNWCSLDGLDEQVLDRPVVELDDLGKRALCLLEGDMVDL